MGFNFHFVSCKVGHGTYRGDCYSECPACADIKLTESAQPPVSAPECEMKGLEVSKMTDSAQPTPEGPYHWDSTGDADFIVGPGNLLGRWPDKLDTEHLNIAFAQGRKSMEAELERVLKEAEDLKIAFGLSKSCVYAIRDQFYKCTGHDAKLAYTMAEEGISNIKIFEKNGSDL